MRLSSLITLIILFVFKAADAQPTAFVLGQVHELQSNILGEKRVLNIYLPEGYQQTDTIDYPVIYLLDGSADEDFIHVSGLVQFYNFSWINQLPKSILVGIANVDRRRDYTFPTTVEKDKNDFPTTGSSAKFIDFLEKELQPYIKRQFNTNGHQMIIGQSLGGLLATEILFKRPSLFDQYLIVSPSLWWDKESLLKIPRAAVAPGTKVYIGVGEEGKVMKNDARALYQLLKRSGGMSSLHFDFLKKENHATIFHKAIMNAFEFWAK
jgi:predicted alpha/beta superfamily hydrolase